MIKHGLVDCEEREHQWLMLVNLVKNCLCHVSYLYKASEVPLRLGKL